MESSEGFETAYNKFKSRDFSTNGQLMLDVLYPVFGG
jgi:hypothetical protein